MTHTHIDIQYYLSNHNKLIIIIFEYHSKITNEIVLIHQKAFLI